jgi:hypothetical protein
MYQMGTVPVGISCMHRIAYHSSSAHPSPLHPIPCWPTRLHCASLSGPPVSIAPYPLSAHSSPLHTAIHHLLYSTLLYYHLYYIPPAHPVASGTHHPRPTRLHQVHTTLGPLVYHGTIIAMGPHGLARLYWYIVTLGCPSHTGEFTEGALVSSDVPARLGLKAPA